MPGPVRLATLAVAALAAVALGACGTDTGANNDYVRNVNAAQSTFATNVTRVSQRITPQSTPRQDQRTLERFQEAIAAVIARLRGIDPPAAVGPDHARLVAAMSGFGADIAEANEALRSPTRTTLERAQQTIGRATVTVNDRINAAISAINRKLGD
jgi:ABC-type phosphate/phosphonate transport system substrate-binding protein